MTRTFPDPYQHVRGTPHDPAREQDSPVPGMSSREYAARFGAPRNGGDSAPAPAAATTDRRRGRTRNGRTARDA